MENAVKALTIAGGILIALMILGALLLMFNNLSTYQNQKDASAKTSQITEFNNQFMAYDKQDLTLMDLKSLYNKVSSHNKKNPEEKIQTNVESVYPGITQEFKTIREEDKQNKVFKCIKIEYENPQGKISKLLFEEVKP
ncbi:MAG: hypothetical protein HFJ37_01810 [Clostridia bacterium]|nr:hypothetical protein [Clostridia bacterium]